MRGSLAVFLAFVLIFTSSTLAQSQEPPVFDEEYLVAYATNLGNSYPLIRDFTGGGARAHGMGNAFLAVSDDVTAVSWNPAGLYRRDNLYEQPVVGLGYQSFNADSKFTNAPWDTQLEFDFNKTFGDWGLMSIVLPVRLKGHIFVGSISYTRLDDEAHNSGMAIDTSLYYDFEDQLAETLRPFHYQNLQNYRSYVNALNVGFGTRLYDRLSMGLAVNAYGGQATRLTLEDVQWDEYIIPGRPGEQRGVLLVENQVYDTTSYSGVYFTVGFQYIGDNYGLGLVIKPPHTMKETIDVFTQSTSYANGVELLGAGSGRHIDDNVVELDQPLTVGLGLSYQPNDKSVLAADIEYRNYGSSMINRRDSLRLVPGGTDVEFFTEFDPHWNNTWVFRLGGEYLWTTGSDIFPVVPLRAGFGYVQIPEPNVEGGEIVIEGENTLLEPTTSMAAKTHFSVGSGLRWSQIQLDVAWMFSTYELENEFWPGGQLWSVDNSTLSFNFTGYF